MQHKKYHNQSRWIHYAIRSAAILILFLLATCLNKTTTATPWLINDTVTEYGATLEITAQGEPNIVMNTSYFSSLQVHVISLNQTSPHNATSVHITEYSAKLQGQGWSHGQEDYLDESLQEGEFWNHTFVTNFWLRVENPAPTNITYIFTIVFEVQTLTGFSPAVTYTTSPAILTLFPIIMPNLLPISILLPFAVVTIVVIIIVTAQWEKLRT
ncbi:MAG: hypothetical protein Q6364_06145 [Candidatus Hermodarchaeota archaeon]|nr:hypothetical protein [Candidatus Hermodarchaeota archaeon]